MVQETQEVLILIQKVLDKDRIAEEYFYNKYKKIIRDYIKSKFANNLNINDIDDYVSSIMIKIYLNLDKYNPEIASFKSWIIAIAKNYVYDKFKTNSISSESISTSNKSYQNDIEIFDFTLSCNLDYYVTCSVSCFENLNSLSYISSQISSMDYNLLNMKYVEGYNYCEIGEKYNLSSDTVSNRVNYIKNKIKKNNLNLILD